MADIQKTDQDWQSELTAEQFRVLREKGTEAPFSGQLLHNKETGIYACAACGNELFASDTKFDSGSGWPSFYDPKSQENIILKEDGAHGMTRTEVLCKQCGGHLGHLFEDAPQTPTGQRYCINSAALNFKKNEDR